MEFEYGQHVLCRDNYGDKWYPHVFCKYLDKTEDNEHFLVFGGWTFEQCIPMEGNEALIYNDGDSPDQPEKPKPAITEYGFLEPVEAFDGERQQWVPALYVKSDGSDTPHNVLLLEYKILDWFKEPEVRRAVRS